MEMLDKIKEFPWRKRIKRLLFETPIEVMIGVLLVGAISGPLIYRNRAARAGEIPIAFSEVEQIQKDFNRAGKPVPPLTEFYAVNNDVPMKVFESNNIALAMGKSHMIFATELRTRVDAAFKTHPLISTYAEEMPQDANAALQSLDKLTTAEKNMPPIHNAFNKAWSEWHHDVTHTKHWTTRECDSKGKNCHTVSHSKTIYDYTIHSYTYHPEAGQRAAALLNAFLSNNPDLAISEKLYLSSETHAENQEAIAKSMKRELEGKTPTEDQYLKFANTWARGSNLLKYASGVANDYGTLRGIANDWNGALSTAHDHRYTSLSHYDSGPREYQIAEQAQKYAGSITQGSHEITDGIAFSRDAVPKLDSLIKQYVDVVLNHKPGDADELRSDIMQTARDIYQKNYEAGFDVQPFKWLDVILWTMLCMALGGAAGFGVDRGLDAVRERYFRRSRDQEDGGWDYDYIGKPKQEPVTNPDVDAQFNPSSPTDIPAPPRRHEAPVEREEPVTEPDFSKMPKPTWQPKPPKGVEITAPLPERPKKEEPAAEAYSAPPANDDASAVKDDTPAGKGDAKWVKKYKDIQP
jgi:hypothetical protein